MKQTILANRIPKKQNNSAAEFRIYQLVIRWKNWTFHFLLTSSPTINCIFENHILLNTKIRLSYWNTLYVVKQCIFIQIFICSISCFFFNDYAQTEKLELMKMIHVFEIKTILHVFSSRWVVVEWSIQSVLFHHTSARHIIRRWNSNFPHITLVPLHSCHSRSIYDTWD